MYSKQLKRPDPFLRRQLQFHPYFLKKLRHIGTISEHTGCVNRLTWSEDGKVLASCSDDLHICLWNMEWNTSSPCSVIGTSHRNNIFGIKFVPQMENKIIITGAMDASVEVHTLADDLRSRISGNLLFCHKAAVKYVEVEPFSPHLFFSVGEDGIVRQYDFRMRLLGCQTDANSSVGRTGSMYRSANCLFRGKEKLKINSMKIDPLNTNLFVLATSENKVSVYDRRVLSLTVPPSAHFLNSSEAVVSFCPEHLLEKPECYASYAEFSPCGHHILATFHSDHAYMFPLFDVRNSCRSSIVCSSREAAPLPWRVRSIEARNLRDKIKQAKDALDIGTKTMDIGLNTTSYNMFTRSIDISLQAITIRDAMVHLNRFPLNSVDSELSERTTQIFVNALVNRAGVCEKRGFVGDDVAGLSDLEFALQLHPHDVEVLIKKTKFLLNLNRPQDALTELDLITGLQHIESNQLIYIQNDIDTLRSKAEFALLDKMRVTPANSRIALQPDDQREFDSNHHHFAHKRRHMQGQDLERSHALVTNENTFDSKVPATQYSNKRAKNLAGSSTANRPEDSSRSSERLVTNYSQRFIGASNIATDIKECVFIGGNGEYCSGGSDDGRFFIWDRFSGEILLCRSADPDVLSCIQPHPTLPIIATSGLDDSVRLWGPSSMKHLFKRLNTNDPFKLQCGKLELPELSRMRLQRPKNSPPPPTDIILPMPLEILRTRRETSAKSSRSMQVVQTSSRNRPSEDSAGKEATFQKVSSRNKKSANTKAKTDGQSSHGDEIANGEFCDANGVAHNGGNGSGSDMGSLSMTSSSQCGRRAEQDSCESASSFSCTRSENSTDSSDYSLLLDDGNSDMVEGESSVDSESRRKTILQDVDESIENHLTQAVLAAQDTEQHVVNLTESGAITIIKSNSGCKLNQKGDGDGDSGSRGSGSGSADRESGSSSGNGSDEGQTACEGTGTGGSASETEESGKTSEIRTNGAIASIGAKSGSHHKKFEKDNTSSDSGSKENDHSGKRDANSDLTSGSGGENSSIRSRSAKQQVDKSSNSLSSNSNNNSDKNSDTDIERAEMHFWKLTSDRSKKPPTSFAIREELEMNLNSSGSSQKMDSKDKSETIASSSDSGSAILKTAALSEPLEDGNMDAAVNGSSVSLSVYRRALQQAVDGLPMDADEALALEEIVADNQRLIKFNPSPLFYRQLSMNSAPPNSVSWSASLPSSTVLTASVSEQNLQRGTNAAGSELTLLMAQSASYQQLQQRAGDNDNTHTCNTS